MWHTNMTTEEWLKEGERFRSSEIMRLRGLANFYNREADKLEAIQKSSRSVRRHIHIDHGEADRHLLASTTETCTKDANQVELP